MIITDRRGLGCSERFTPRDIPPLETLVDDLKAVLDEAGSERPADPHVAWQPPPVGIDALRAVFSVVTLVFWLDNLGGGSREA